MCTEEIELIEILTKRLICTLKYFNNIKDLNEKLIIEDLIKEINYNLQTEVYNIINNK